jgi:Family of unknown function (DUF6496)
MGLGSGLRTCPFRLVRWTHPPERACGLRRIELFTSLSNQETAMAKYGSTAKRKVKKAMHERKKGTLKSGRSGKKVTSRKQAIAIGLSEARRKGGKVPAKKKK